MEKEFYMHSVTGFVQTLEDWKLDAIDWKTTVEEEISAGFLIEVGLNSLGEWIEK